MTWNELLVEYVEVVGREEQALKSEEPAFRPRLFLKWKGKRCVTCGTSDFQIWPGIEEAAALCLLQSVSSFFGAKGSLHPSCFRLVEYTGGQNIVHVRPGGTHVVKNVMRAPSDGEVCGKDLKENGRRQMCWTGQKNVVLIKDWWHNFS